MAFFPFQIGFKVFSCQSEMGVLTSWPLVSADTPIWEWSFGSINTIPGACPHHIRIYLQNIQIQFFFAIIFWFTNWKGGLFVLIWDSVSRVLMACEIKITIIDSCICKHNLLLSSSRKQLQVIIHINNNISDFTDSYSRPQNNLLRIKIITPRFKVQINHVYIDMVI